MKTLPHYFSETVCLAALLLHFGSANAQTVSFADTNLEAAVRQALAKPTGDLLESDMASLTSLWADSRGIQDLLGLETATNLTFLEIGWQFTSITNTWVFSKLVNLTHLAVQCSGLRDASFARNLAGLDHLDLYSNQVKDATPIAGLTNLTYLHLGWNGTTNLNLLSGLTNLHSVTLDGDFLTDIAFLDTLPQLELLSLINNQLTSFPNVSVWPGLTVLNLDNNSLGAVNPRSALGPTNLQQLRIDSCEIPDLNFLTNFPTLQVLWAEGNAVQDPGPLAALTHVTELYLAGNRLTTITPMAALARLTRLGLANNLVSDLSPLGGLSNLTYLDLRTNNISEIGALLSLAHLSSVDLSGNFLEVSLNSPAMGVIASLQARAATVNYLPQFPPLSIAVQPASRTNNAGTTASFSIVASGISPLGFQWWKDGDRLIDGADVSGASTATLNLDSLLAADAGGYSVVVSNVAGSVTSLIAALAVLDPAILSPPVSVCAGFGQDVAFSVGAAGTGPLMYQWFRGSVPMPGATNASWILTNVQPLDADRYLVTVSNRYGAVTSTAVTLAVALPYAATQPAVLVTASSATLAGMALANGAESLAWFEWGTNSAYGQITGITNVGAGLTVARVYADIGALASGSGYSFRQVVSNAVGVAYGTEQRFITGGRVLGWGMSSFGRIAVPFALRDATQVAGSLKNSLAIRTDGTVVAWGDNTYGQANIPAGLGSIVQVACGVDHALALRVDGSVVAWGHNNFGQTDVPSGVSNVVAVAAGGGYSVALRADGTVASWGSMTLATGLSNIVAICAGSGALGLEAGGTVVALASSMTIPAGLSNIVAIAAGQQHYLALRSNGTVVAWGHYWLGQPAASANVSNVVSISAGGSHGLALLADGTLATWGKYISESTYMGTFAYVPADTAGVLAIASGSDHCLAIRPLGPMDFAPFACTQEAFPGKDGDVELNGMAVPNGLPTVAWFEWSLSTNYDQVTGPLNIGSAPDVVRVNSNIQGLDAGVVGHYRLVVSNQVAVIRGAEFRFTTGSRVVVWGDASYGKTAVPAIGSSVFKMAAGHDHSLVLQTNRQVVAWGYHFDGETNTPVDLTDVVNIAGGYDHSLAVRSDGTVVAWGKFYTGQMIVPPGLSNVIAVAGGDSHSLALKQDGTVTAWGDATYGQGNAPGGLGGVVAISAGSDFSVALRADGSACAWGNGYQSRVDAPVGLSDIVALSAETWSTIALRKNGTAVSWGTQYYVPSSLSNLVAVASGMYNTMSLDSNGRVTIWGSTNYGLEDLPANVTNAVAICSGDSHCLALVPDLPPTAIAQIVTGSIDSDCIIKLIASDPEGDTINFRLSALPASGRLYQYSAIGRGPVITAVGSPVTDSEGRVIFVPDQGATGAPYTTFSVVANDGLKDSDTALIRIDIVLQVTIQVRSLNLGQDGTLTLEFAGLSNQSYSVWASTDLASWTRLGNASESSPAQYIFEDHTARNWPQRFYRITAP